jgi:hypothetical protein
MFTTENLASSYTRKQAIEDGFLIAVDSKLSKEAGITYPVACSARLWQLVEPTPLLKAQCQSLTGRLWDLLYLLRFAIKAKQRREENFSQVFYHCLFIEEKRRTNGKPYVAKRPTTFTIKALVAQGDDLEPVLTLMFHHED